MEVGHGQGAVGKLGCLTGLSLSTALPVPQISSVSASTASSLTFVKSGMFLKIDAFSQ